MTETQVSNRPTRVFISHSHEDASAAALIARSLQLDFAVELSKSSLEFGQTIRSAIFDAIESSDVVVVLLSAAALRSPWLETETVMALRQETKRRDIDLVPVLLEPCEVPESLQNRIVVDLSKDGAIGVGRLITRLMKDRAVDFAILDERNFLRLVGDVLEREFFDLTISPAHPDLGHDFLGIRNGEHWLVEVKHYHSKQRMSVSMIQQVVAKLRRREPAANALLVTSSQLTSVAREYLQEVVQSGSESINLVDGVELKQLLAKYPDLVDKYFALGRPARG